MLTIIIWRFTLHSSKICGPSVIDEQVKSAPSIIIGSHLQEVLKKKMVSHTLLPFFGLEKEERSTKTPFSLDNLLQLQMGNIC